MTLFLALLCALALPLAAEPPVRESIDLTAVTLNRLVLQPAPGRTAGLLPKKKDPLPLSVQLFLRPSGQLNSLAGPVQKAAAIVRRRVAPGSKQADLLRDSQRMAQAVQAYLDEALPLDPSAGWSQQPATDQRLAWPKASEIWAAGKAGPDARAMAAVALLRALGVPARTAWARGQLCAQYWVALEPPLPPAKAGAKAKGKPKSAPKPPLGWWALLDPDLHEAEVDAWSLDPGVLARAIWFPEQELSAPILSWQRVIFAEGDSLSARAAFDASLQAGRLSGSAGVGLPLSAAAQAVLAGLTQGSATLWVLTVQQQRLVSDGAMASMEPVDLLTPYRPHLSSWGRELRGPVREMELEAQGLLSDRPGRLRLNSAGKPKDEWKSPPPALGVLHYLSFGMRRNGSVLQAKRDGDQISGKLYRADNLSPRAAWALTVQPQGLSYATQTLTVEANGAFSAALAPEEAQAEWIELSTPPEKQLQWNGDRQWLFRP